MQGSAANDKLLPGRVAHIVATQREDGSWAHPRLSACNVAALALAHARGVSTAESIRAYKRGLRWMRANGVGEMTPRQFEATAREAVAWGA